MKGSTLSKLVSRGISPHDPSFMARGKKIEDDENSRRQTQLKSNCLRGFSRIHQLTSPNDISHWLRFIGPSIRIGLIHELEIWQRRDEYMLAVAKPNWEVYRVALQDGLYRLINRVI